MKHIMELPKKKYQIIYADPPWAFDTYSKKGQCPATGKMPYATMGYQDIAELPVKDIADDECVLFLWVTYPTMHKAFKIIKDWGFIYKTVAFTWIKTNKDGTPRLGLGFWTRSNAEICLLCTKKKFPKRISCSVRQLIMSKQREHSRKPDEARDRIVELLGDLPRIELFARQRFEGWDAWGNEVPKEVQKEI